MPEFSISCFHRFQLLYYFGLSRLFAASRVVTSESRIPAACGKKTDASRTRRSRRTIFPKFQRLQQLLSIYATLFAFQRSPCMPSSTSHNRARDPRHPKIDDISYGWVTSGRRYDKLITYPLTKQYPDRSLLEMMENKKTGHHHFAVIFITKHLVQTKQQFCSPKDAKHQESDQKTLIPIHHGPQRQARCVAAVW